MFSLLVRTLVQLSNIKDLKVTRSYPEVPMWLLWTLLVEEEVI